MAYAETGLAVPVPAEVPAAPGHAITGPTSGLELCVPADLPAIVDAWTRVRTQRAAQVTIHLSHAPVRAVVLHLVDARHRYGVYLGVFVGSDGIRIEHPQATLFRRRACSMQRNEIGVIVAVDAAFTEVLGWTEEEMVGTKTLDMVHPDDKAPGIVKWMEMLRRPGRDQRLVVRLAHRNGGFRWCEVTNRNLLGDPTCGRVLTDLIDVSDRMEAVEALRASEELLQRLAQALPIGVAQIDADRHIVYRNDLLSELLGVADAEDIDGQFALVAASDRIALAAAMNAVLACGTPADVELTIDLPAHTRRGSIALRAISAADGATTGAIVCVTDVTERVRLSSELERRAKFDDLTRCHNRASIYAELEATLSAGERETGGIAVIFIDLNRFKEINDRYGHAAGDDILQVIATRIMANVRDVDLVGRLGGDEFLVVCPDIAAPQVALDIARRVAAALNEPAGVGMTSIVPGASIGVAWTNDATGCDALVATADEAMYEAKRCADGPVLALR
jgi:diguanylate cyclase (GGDEF)-like protein/PAS domain S-box-containing protein